MMIDNSIFDLPFKPDENLQPTPEQMKAFLESAGKDGGKGLHGDDLINYRRLLESADAFKQTQLQDAKREDLRKHMLYAVLRYSRFADHDFLSTVTLLKYHLHALKLKSTECNDRTLFIRAAEKTLSRLDKNKLDDVLRMVRLQEMIAERKKIVEKHKLPSLVLTAELSRIAQHIQKTLARIKKRCEVSIVLLSDLDVIGKKEGRIIDDIKERPQKALLDGKITMQYLEPATREVNLIADIMSSVIREDINALKGLYETIQEQLRKTVQVLEAPLAEIERKKNRSIEEQQQLFSTVEQALAALLSIHHFEQPATGMHTDTAYEKFITKKRKEMLGYLFEVLQKDRRSLPDRRSSEARRKYNDPYYQGPARRRGKDRRTEKIRRGSMECSL